jgi:tetratricopeptide (TPR) repeat protein
LANALFKRRKYSEASLVFQEATKLGLLDEKLYSTALNSYSRSGKIEQMRKTFQAALETGHADGQIFHIMMMSEARLDNLESAQNLLEIALGRGIADEKIFGGMALSFLKQRRSEDASRIFDMALNSGKVDRYLFDLMIPTCMKFSAIAQARHAWDKAMELDLGAAHKYGPELLNHYLDNQQWEDAITVYEQLKESKLPNIVHDYSHSMILAYGELGDLESAKSIYFRRVRKKKADSRTFNAMITVFKNAGLLEDMGRSYRRAVERGMANEETHRLVEGINGSD